MVAWILKLAYGSLASALLFFITLQFVLGKSSLLEVHLNLGLVLTGIGSLST